MMDAIAKGRLNNVGAANSRCKVTKEIAHRILDLHSRGNVSRRDLALKFGVSIQPIRSIINGTHWTVKEQENVGGT